MLVREYLSHLVKHRDYPRETRIPTLLHVLSIPWLQNMGPLTIRGSVVLAGGVAVATIEREVRWYVRTVDIGRVVPRIRLPDGTPIRFHVPVPEHVGSTLWKILGGRA